MQPLPTTAEMSYREVHMKLIDIEPVIKALAEDHERLPKAEDGKDEYEKGYNEGWRAASAHIQFLLKMVPSVIPEVPHE